MAVIPPVLISRTYLVPQGYEKVGHENGYNLIVKEGRGRVEAPEADLEDILF